MNGDRVFLDTNILVYAHDSSAGDKHAVAKQKVAELWDSGLGVLSTQVLQEFYVVVTSKVPKPLPPDAAQAVIGALLRWDIIVNDGDSVIRAIDLQQQSGYPFWDCMILVAAADGQANVLLSEDLAHGRTVNGVRIVNPFRNEP